MNGQIHLFVAENAIPHDVMEPYNRLILPHVQDIPIYSDVMVVDTYTPEIHAEVGRFKDEWVGNPYYRSIGVTLPGREGAGAANFGCWGMAGMMVPEDGTAEERMPGLLRKNIVATQGDIRRLFHGKAIETLPDHELSYIIWAHRDYVSAIEDAAQEIGMTCAQKDYDKRLTVLGGKDYQPTALDTIAALRNAPAEMVKNFMKRLPNRVHIGD